MKYQYGLHDYIAAIKREQQKRATTYPKIIAKMEKNNFHNDEIKYEFQKQCSQSTFLRMCIDTLSGDHSGQTTPYFGIFQELIREYKMRLKCYPRFVYFKRITQAAADYEISLWKELTMFFADNYLGNAQLAIEAMETKKRRIKTPDS